MSRFIIKTESAPKAVGTYSQGVAMENLIFTAGQIPLDPATGKLIEGHFKERVHQVLKNLNAVLSGAGSSLDCAVKLTVFLTDMSRFAELNEAFSEVFLEDPPARSAVEVSALPLGTDVEIECIATRQ
mgnify:FL=1